MKKFLSVAALGIAAAGVFALASCKDDSKTETTTTTTETTTNETPTTTTEKESAAAAKLLQNLIFEADGTAVTADLSLPAYLQNGADQVLVNWTADSELVTINALKEDADAYVATVARPDSESVTVTLTATIELADGKASKTYTVVVNPYTVSDAIDAFKFEQAGATVYKAFEVPTSFEFAGQNVAISWSVPDDYKTYLSVGEDGKTVSVTEQEEKTRAQITATFKYKEETLSRTYRLTVYHERTALELLHAFYDEPASESYTLKGYVIHKAGFDADYKNGYLYIADQTLQGGYYVYRAYCTQEVWDTLKIGTAVEIPACKSTEYSGLIEVGQNKENIVSVTEDLPELTAEQLETLTKGFAADDMFVLNGLGASDAIKYYTGTRVNLTSWKVVAVNADTTAKAGGDLVTLQKDDVKVVVYIAKYATPLDGDVAKAAVAEAAELKVGDFVNAVGILNYRDGAYCIYVSEEDTFTVTTDDANASLVATADILAPINALVSKFPASLTEAMVLDTATITAADGVTFTVTVDNDTLAVWNEKVLTITPTSDAVTLKVTISATNGTYTITKTVEVYAKAMTTAEKVAAEKEAYTSTIDEYGVYELATAGSKFTDVAISYALAEDTEYATLNENELTVLSVDENQTVKLNVTFTLGDVSETKEVTLTITNKARYYSTETAVTAPEENKEYFFGLNQENLGEYIYATGAISSNKLATSTAPAKVMTVTAEKKDSTYAFKLASGKYIALNKDGKLELVDEAFYWTYDSTNAAWVGTVESNKYFLGTFGTNNTISASASSYLSNDGQFKANLYSLESLTKTRAEKCEYEFGVTAAAISSDVDSGSTIKLPTTGSLFDDVTATYALKEGSSGATIDGGKITFDNVTTETKINFVATLTCGSVTVTKEFYFNVQPVEFLDVTEAVKDAVKDETVIYIKGVVTSINTSKNYCWITDGTTEFEVYGALNENSPLGYGDIAVGDVINVSGTYAEKYGIKETQAGATIFSKEVATDAQKAAVTVSELAVADQFEDAANIELATAGTTFNTVTISWAVKEGTAATVTGNKMTVTLGDEISTVTLTATVTSGEVTKTQDVSFKVYDKTTFKAYSAVSKDTTADKCDPLATSFGLDSTIFTVTYDKGNTSTQTALRTDGVRMYATKGGVGNSLTFTAGTGYTIDWVMFSFDSDTYSKYAVVKAGDTVLTAADGVYTVNGSAFTIVNDNTNETSSNTQVRFTRIVIHYTVSE